MCLAMLSVIGGVVSAVGSMASASAQAASYNAQSQMAERQAVMERDAGAFEAGRARDRADRTLAGMRGQYMSSGIALEGSPVDVLRDSATEASLDEQAILYGAGVRSDNLRFESSLAKMNAGNAMMGGALGAFGNVLSGINKQMDQNHQRTMLRNPYQMTGGGL